MKKTNKPLFTFLNIVVAVLIVVAFSTAFALNASAEDADYNWQSIPTSPEGLAEGAYYLDFTDYWSLVWYTIDIPVPQDLWFYDAQANVVRSESNYENTGYFSVNMTPDRYPLCSQYIAYRFVTRVGESWDILSSLNGGYSIAGCYLNYPAIARQVIADDDTLTDENYEAVLAAVGEGEWMVERGSGLMKGCYLLPAALAQSETDAYRFVYPSAEYYENCVTNEVAPLPEMPDFSHMSGQWSDDISWTLDDGVLTISGTGAMEARQERKCSNEPRWSRLSGFFTAPTITFSESSYYYTNDSILEDQIEKAVLAQIGYPNEAALDRAATYGLIDFAEYGEFYMKTALNVKVLVIEEGITSIDNRVFNAIAPQTVILPASLTSAALEPSYPFVNSDVYILNGDTDFDAVRIDVFGLTPEGAGMKSLSTEEFLDMYVQTYKEMIRIASGTFRWDDALKAISEARRNSTTSVYSYRPAKTEAHVLADWNYYTGDNYTSADALVADAIAALNDLYGTAFTALEDMYMFEGEYSQTAKKTEAYQAAEDSFYEAMYEQVIAEYPEYEPMVASFRAEDSVFVIGQLGHAFEPLEDGSMPIVSEWITVHGYLGSTAETASAASGVRFVPLCPTDYTHTVTDKAEIAATCTTAGTEAGWYCEDCGVYLTGGETIPATNHPNAYETPATEATATEHGHTAGVYCPDCNDWISGHDVIHNILGPYYPVEEAPDFDPDELIAYSEDGDYIIYCSVCNEPGLYKLEVGTPDEPGDSGSGNIFTRVIEAIRNAFGGVVNFFLRLIKWLGGK